MSDPAADWPTFLARLQADVNASYARQDARRKTMSEPNTPDAATLARWCALAAKLDGWRDVEIIGGMAWGRHADVSRPRGVLFSAVPDYAESLDEVARLEALVRERGREYDYADALLQIACERDLTDGGNLTLDGSEVFRLATATAAQRLEAVLVACGVLDGDETP